ncbi:MAG: nucleotidyl transferase AbiEii/AbiGii toxin family protein [Elusimicrobia bacterium]|nr:nucleotidyl transferase AbiEii/AbiGii toxin family protein [Elusimicrobiota bacterium]MBP9698829.1 nucleotidyl transferase AbiEii/AbiGii toxin family protein [Elusimicrobiota bacterium]
MGLGSKFIHELLEAKVLFATLGAEKNIPPLVIEKDYWVMHCLWGLQNNGFQFEMKGGTSLSKGWRCIDRFSEDIDIRFEPTAGLHVKGDKSTHIEARLAFYDDLASKIHIPGITVERNRTYDDEKAQNGGIGLKYASHFTPLPGLKSEVLLEVGFARTAPNEPRDVTSWALERALQAKVDVVDNRAKGVKCFNPEYTFVDKLQTICKRFRQHRDRNEERDRPRQFLRHYYDLFKLLEIERVRKFIGSEQYQTYKQEKLRGQDAREFESRKAFTFPDIKVYRLFEKEFQSMGSLLLAPGPSFKDVVIRVRKHSPTF